MIVDGGTCGEAIASITAPSAESPRIQPTVNSSPLRRPRGVASMRMMAMIGSGLIATPAARPSTSPRTLPMQPFLKWSLCTVTLGGQHPIGTFPRRFRRLSASSLNPAYGAVGTAPGRSNGLYAVSCAALSTTTRKPLPEKRDGDVLGTTNSIFLRLSGSVLGGLSGREDAGLGSLAGPRCCLPGTGQQTGARGRLPSRHPYGVSGTDRNRPLRWSREWPGRTPWRPSFSRIRLRQATTSPMAGGARRRVWSQD